MEVTFTLKVTCRISDIEGHGVEEEKRRVRQDILDCGLPGAVQCGRIQAYSIDSVIVGE
jgi:hypothetical protein